MNSLMSVFIGVDHICIITVTFFKERATDAQNLDGELSLDFPVNLAEFSLG